MPLRAGAEQSRLSPSRQRNTRKPSPMRRTGPTPCTIPDASTLKPIAMPLPAPTARREAHHRIIDMRAYSREDGLYDVEAHLVDTKPFPYVRLSSPQPTPAGHALHDLWVRLTVADDY